MHHEGRDDSDHRDDQLILSELERLTELKWSLMVDRKITSANKVSRKIYELERTIPGRPDGGRWIIDRLAHASQEDLRLLAATHLVPIDIDAAKALLAFLERNASNVHVKITARVTLEQIEAGNIDYYKYLNISKDGQLLP